MNNQSPESVSPVTPINADAGSLTREHKTQPPEIVFIDEKNPLQPYVQHGELQRFLDFNPKSLGSFSTVSDEGYAHNEERQRETGRAIVELFKLKERGELLDVGWGANKFIGEGVDAAGVPVSLLDFIGGSVGQDNPPTEIAQVDGKLRAYVGDVEDISSPASALKDKRFGALLFNGSWAAGGNNWTVQEILSGKYAEERGSRFDTPEYEAFFDSHLSKIVSLAKDHLTPNGILIFTSPRYTYHGAGYHFRDLTKEKVEFLDLIRRNLALGAKKITIVGVSNDGVRAMLEYNLSNNNMQAEEQALHSLVLGGFRPPEFTLRDSHGQKLGYDQLTALLKDDAKREELLKNPQLAQRVDHILTEYKSFGEEVVTQVTGGLNSLPDELEYSTISARRIKQVKQDLQAVPLSTIGRIDAIGAEF